MTFDEAQSYLLGLEMFGIHLGLERMHPLLTALGMPQHRFASIHVVGTNGKSSTARMIAGVLQRHGLRTGTYTSPHLRSFCERIEVDGQPISNDQFAATVALTARAVELVNKTLEPDRITQFEALTAAAFYELARRKVDVCVVEAGLGGRYDATNVIQSTVQVLTGVSLDHTRWLGSTVEQIALEKLAVVGDHGTLVVGEIPESVWGLARSQAQAHSARLVKAPPDTHAALGVRGGFQRRNFALACAASEAFLGRLDQGAVKQAATEVRSPGRLEVVSDEPMVVFDGAHNPAGADALADALPAVVGDRAIVGVFCVMDDKDASAILARLMPLCVTAIFTRCQNRRSLEPAALEALAKQHSQCPTQAIDDPHQAFAAARNLANSNHAVVATGSIYLVGELASESDAVAVGSM